MAPEFKVVTYIHPLKEAKRDFQPNEFEKIINQLLQEGWKVVNVNSVFMGGVSPQNGIHYWAYLVKD
ncbi:MAG: hypothetical protein HWN66_05165 [Candidatus Helarchaeota archaeon]|nr:hypothetical protein [Candidatus Helarchaeota archaeon]